MSSYRGAKTWDSASSSFVYTKPKSDGNYGEAMLHLLDDLKTGASKSPPLSCHR